MSEEIHDLLDYLVCCKDHIENDQYSRIPYWRAEYDRTRNQLAEAWAAETADAAN
jgi:hypothetical protein